MQRSHCAKKFWINFQDSGLIYELFNIIHRCLWPEIFFSPLWRPHTIGGSSSLCSDLFICLISLCHAGVCLADFFTMNLGQLVSDRGRLSESATPDPCYMLSFPRRDSDTSQRPGSEQLMLMFLFIYIVSWQEEVLRVGGPQLAHAYWEGKCESWLTGGESLRRKVTDTKTGSGTEASQATLGKLAELLISHRRKT